MNARLSMDAARAVAAAARFPEALASAVAACENGDGPRGVGSTTGGLTRSSDSTREGLAMKATRNGIDDLLAEVRERFSITPEEARRIREEAGVSTRRLGTALGVSGATITRWESGGVQPRPDARDAWVRAINGLQEILQATSTAAIASTFVADVVPDTRTNYALRRSGLYTLGQVAECSESDLRKIRNFGTGSVEIVRSVLAEAGLELSPTPRSPEFTGGLVLSEAKDELRQAPRFMDGQS